jgi:hypothetical protein
MLSGSGGSTVRHGAPNGPWRELPAPFRNGAGSLIDGCGRIRTGGLAPKALPIAPLSVGLKGATSGSVEVTPTAKGVAVDLSFLPAVDTGIATPVLTITSRVAGSITLRDIDVVWHEG